MRHCRIEPVEDSRIFLARLIGEKVKEEDFKNELNLSVENLLNELEKSSEYESINKSEKINFEI